MFGKSCKKVVIQKNKLTKKKIKANYLKGAIKAHVKWST